MRLNRTFLVRLIAVSWLIVFSTLGPWARGDENNFGFIFRENGNTLDTFQGTYTKEMYGDPSVTVKMSLSKDDLDSIYKKMVEIDFFQYPRDLTQHPPTSPGPTGISAPFLVTNPSTTYYFKVASSSGFKEVSWNNRIMQVGGDKDLKIARLKELISVITNIVHSKNEFKSLPAPKRMPM
jgi:hypothetical protein